jgi:beta-xylosidase
VESLVEATTYWPGGNRRFTWENQNVPMPSAVKKIIAERKETEEDQEEEKVVQEEINTNAAPTGQVEGEETRKTFKTLLDISSFKMSKNEVLQGALGFGIFVIAASYIVGATYTREDGREISGNARGWSGVRQERESLYDSAFKAYASV